MPDEKIVELHRLSKNDEQGIYLLVEDHLRVLSGDNASLRKDKEMRQATFKQFLKNRTPLYRGVPRPKGPLRLCYEEVPQLLDITGLTYLDIFKAISKNLDGNPYPPQWASETETLMCSYSDLLSEEQRSEIMSLINALSSPKVSELDEPGLPPLQKITKASNMRSHSTTNTAKQAAELGMVKQYRRRNMSYNYNALEFNTLPFMAVTFDVSLHWLLDLDEKYCVLAANGQTETIMAKFCLLPEDRKNIVLKAVETAINNGGVL